jgi:hypothetical protein
MKTIIFFLLLGSFQLLIAQKESSDLHLARKNRFKNYIGSLTKLPECFKYNNYIQLNSVQPIKSKEFIDFNMASYQDIKQYEFENILNSRYVMGYFKNHDNSVCILTVSKTDSIQDSLKGYLFSRIEILLYDEFGNKIAQYKPETHSGFSFTLEENKMNISYTVKSAEYIDEEGNYSEGEFEYKIQTTISTSQKGISIEESENTQILIKSTNQENYTYTGKLIYTNGNIYEGEFNLYNKWLKDKIIIEPVISNHVGTLTKFNGNSVSGVMCGDKLCNFPDYSIGNSTIRNGDTLSKKDLLKSEGIKLINNPYNYSISSYSLIFMFNDKITSYEGSGNANQLYFNDDIRKLFVTNKTGKMFISMRGRTEEATRELPYLVINLK